MDLLEGEISDDILLYWNYQPFFDVKITDVLVKKLNDVIDINQLVKLLNAFSQVTHDHGAKVEKKIENEGPMVDF